MYVINREKGCSTASAIGPQDWELCVPAAATYMTSETVGSGATHPGVLANEFRWHSEKAEEKQNGTAVMAVSARDCSPMEGHFVGTLNDCIPLFCILFILQIILIFIL